MNKALFVFCMIFCSWYGAAHAQQLSIPPAGAYWIYQNEGLDKNIRYIRIEQARDSLITEDTFYLRVSPAHIYLEDWSGKRTYKGYYAMIYEGELTQINLPRGDDSAHAISPHDLYNLLYDSVMYYTAYKTGGGEIKVDSVSHIQVNGVKLRIKYLGKQIYPPGHCNYFCGPLLERIGSLGYMVPLNTCVKDTLYAGRLLTYYDPEIGIYNVPDSLRNMACSFVQYSGIEEAQQQAQLTVFPNPVINSFRLKGSNATGQAITVRLADMTGRYYKSLLLPAGDFSVDCDITGLQAGVYLLMYSNNYAPQKILKY